MQLLLPTENALRPDPVVLLTIYLPSAGRSVLGEYFQLKGFLSLNWKNLSYLPKLLLLEFPYFDQKYFPYFCIDCGCKYLSGLGF